MATAGAAAGAEDQALSELHEKHRIDLERLTLTSQPFRTFALFALAIGESIKSTCVCVLKESARLKFLVFLVVSAWVMLLVTDGPHEKHVQELLWYVRFGLWWVILGVASSIGLGSGLHTFVLYLGPHIALFTIKAVHCSRTDLKSAPYDTIVLKMRPSWLEKDCLEFGPPMYQDTIPFSKILHEVHLEAFLWGIGTALGELPPYFLSRAARMSGRKLDELGELDASITGEGFLSSTLHRAKRWLMSHSEHLNFPTILLLASVPNPLFDLAGILCGQFNIPFWKFFLATLIGKAVIKVYIQTTLVITLCNNQLLELLEKRIMWVFGNVPVVSSVLPSLVGKLKTAKKKFLSASVAASASSAVKETKWNLSFSLIWNTIVWLLIMNFIVQIITSTAQSYLKRQQELETRKKLSATCTVSEPSPVL
ncbi:vacuole membrane protein KMS1-like [Oryza brachyantha]|uniref:Vacuole membrane protein KMS1 n=1 Tax=Oryza brachyantha TaxID=4533 RepID=J3MM84_ORYBR|nr:vacuole membrane protein KMS1-like [Oryza brachyantha]